MISFRIDDILSSKRETQRFSENGNGFKFGTSLFREDRCRKRQRYTFSASQVYYLEMVFAKSRYISQEKRLELAKWLGLSEQQVKIWFQNRRYKSKLRLENEKTTELAHGFYHFQNQNQNHHYLVPSFSMNFLR